MMNFSGKTQAAALCAIFTALWFAPGWAQATEKRIGLVIVNDAYVAGLGDSTSAVLAVNGVTTALRKDGFDVAEQHNLSREQMRDAIVAFSKRLDAAGPEGVGFLYFSGLGFGDPRDKQNYLIPADAKSCASSTDLVAYAYRLNDVLDTVEAASAKAAIIVLDARSGSCGQRGIASLVQAQGHANMVVAYAAGAGTTAVKDGLYAQVLAEELTSPGASTSTVFSALQSRIGHATGRAQAPQVVNGLIEQIVFVPGGAPPPSNRADPEANYWTAISPSTNVSDFEAYKRKFPKGAHVAQAEEAITHLRSAPQASRISKDEAKKAFDAGQDAYLLHQDYKQAATLFEMSCGGGVAAACAQVSQLYEVGGHGMTKDFVRARSFSMTACDAGEGRGCFVLANIYFYGEGVTKDPVQAKLNYEKACNTDKNPNPTACAEAGLFYGLGIGVPKDMGKFNMYLNRCSYLSRTPGERQAACELQR